MSQLQTIFNRIQETKKEQKELKSMYKDALTNNQEYQLVKEELANLKEKKKKIEDRIKEDFRSEFSKLDTLKLDIENDNMLLSDAAISKVTKGEMIEIVDKNNVKYEPIFNVRFKKIG